MTYLRAYERAGYATSNLIDPTDSGSRYLKQRKDDFYQAHYPLNAAMWQQGFIDKRFKVGDQSLNSMLYGEGYTQGRRFFFNLIKRHILMTTGYQRRNRKSTITMPVNDTDALADDYNKVLKWSENRDGFQEYLSQSFEGACDTGINLLWLYPSYVLDPISGDLFTDSVAYCNFLIDSLFRKQDLSDCNGIWRRRWCTKNACKTLLPGHSAEIDKMLPAGTKDGRFPLQAELMGMDSAKLYAFDEFHYRDSRETTIIIDPKTGEAVEWEEDEEDDPEMLERVLAQQPWLKTKKIQVPTVKVCISINDRNFYDGPNLLNIDTYPCVPTVCYHEPDIQSYMWRFTGMVRNMRDAQYLYNLRKVIELDLLQSQVTNAWIYPVDVLVDPKALNQTGNGCKIPIKAGHLPNEIQRLDAPGIPQTLMELSRSLSEDITRICGVNEELLGSATDDKSGILSMLRQGAGLTTLQGIFDKLDYTQRLYGKIRLQAIRKLWSRGKIVSILGHEPDQRFFTSHSLKYSIAVEEGNYSTTQRQMELQQYLHFKEIGMTVADKTIWRAAFLTDKAKAMEEASEEKQSQQQAQEAQQQQAEKMDNAKIMALFAKSKLDLASEKDKQASVHERFAKITDLQAGSEHKIAEADLARVREMIELEDMDLENFKKTIQLAQFIKSINQKELQQTQAQGA